LLRPGLNTALENWVSVVPFVVLYSTLLLPSPIHSVLPYFQDPMSVFVAPTAVPVQVSPSDVTQHFGVALPLPLKTTQPVLPSSQAR